MSTDLSMGHRLVAGTDPFDFLDEVRAALDPVRDQLDARRLVTDAVTAIDQANLTGVDHPEQPLRAAYSAYLTDQASQNPRWRFQDPHRFCVRLGRDPVDGRIFALVLAEERELFAAFGELRAVEKFGYWSAEYPPDGVTEQAWANRLAFWDRVLPTGRYGDARLEWSLRTSVSDGLHALMPEAGVHPLMLDQLPCDRSRALRLARSALVERVVRDLGDGRQSRYITHVTGAMNAVARGEHPALVDAATALIAPIDADALTGGRIATPDDVADRRAAMTAATESAFADHLATEDED